MTDFLFILAAAVLAAGCAAWVLRAYRRASPEAPRAGPAFAAAGAGLAAAIGVYLLIGRPDLADQPYAQRMEALHRRPVESYTAEEVLAILAEAAKHDADDARPLLYSGQIYSDLGRPREAARDYEDALRRDPNSAEAMLGLGRALVRIEEGRVSPQAQRLFEAAAAAAPDDPLPWLYRAVAAGQAGDEARARSMWGETLKRLAPDDPRRAMAERMSKGE